MDGKLILTIDNRNALKGMSQSPYSGEHGFSPDSVSVNLLATPGVVSPAAALTNKSTGVTGNLLAWTPGIAGSSINGFMVSDDGVVYSINTSQVVTASSALSGTYQTGTTDMEQFIDRVYITSTTDVALIKTDLTSGNAVWWSSTESNGVLTAGVRHPLQRFQDLLWIGDANSLHNIASSSSTNKGVLVLNADKEITALGVEPAGGLMLIATTQGANYSDTISSGNSVFTYDGFSATYTREYKVDGMVTAFKNVGGVTYVFYGGNKVGYWNGSGITFLRTLKNISFAGANLPYKHHSAGISNVLYIADGTQILAYGEVIQGSKVWWYCGNNTVNSNIFNMIAPVGNNLLGLGFATNKFYTFDPVATGGLLSFFGNKVVLGRPYAITTMRVITTGVTGNNVNQTIQGLIYSESGSFLATQSATPILKTGTFYTTDFKWGGIKVNSIQPFVGNIGSATFGIVAIHVYANDAE